jgi:hypothetical protein
LRPILLAFCLIASTASCAWAVDDTPLFGSEATGVIQINLPERMTHAGHENNVTCTSQGCIGLQRAAIREVANVPQP